MPRAIWTGAISFGLVYIPVQLHSASRSSSLDLDFLDKRDFSPEGLASRSHAEYVEGDTLEDMIKEDLVAERIAIDSYREMINYLAQEDSTTRRMLEEILAKEEEHADDLSSLLEDMAG